ncbi:hypothetical protein [Rothia nasimurium]|uniref:hypothetical protein n=1 Tax=Rothia nasimurium TaxID=85336 RepID=UPI003B9E03BE
MKIRTETNTFSPFSLIAERGEYDALPPLDTLHIDFAPTKVNADRLAIASYLVFGSYASGTIEMPKKFCPATAEAMEQDARPVQLRPSPIEYYPQPLAIGQRTAKVYFGLPGESPEGQFGILPSDSYSGIITGPNKLLLASNAFVFDALTNSGQDIRARLAVAVLFAEDFSIDTFILDGTAIDRTEQRTLINLLASCRLGLQFLLPTTDQ